MRRLLVFLLLFSSAFCYACDCVRRPACGGFSTDRRYFTGTPISRHVIGERSASEPTAIYLVDVSESFSSGIPAGTKVEVRTGTGGADCSWHFHIGKAYLFEAIPSNGQLYTSYCTLTGQLDRSEILLRSLRSLKNGQKPASLLGDVVQWDRTVDNSEGKEPYRPLAGISVIARSQHGETWNSVRSAGHCHVPIVTAWRVWTVPRVSQKSSPISRSKHWTRLLANTHSSFFQHGTGFLQGIS